MTLKQALITAALLNATGIASVAGVGIIRILTPKPHHFVQYLGECDAPWRYVGDKKPELARDFAADALDLPWTQARNPMWTSMNLSPDVPRGSTLQIVDHDGNVGLIIKAGDVAYFVCDRPPVQCHGQRYDSTCT